MNLAVKILLGVGGSGATAASGYGIYEFIRPKTIREQLIWEGKELLGTEENQDDSDWDSLKTKYVITGNTDKFSGLETTAVTDKTKLREHCKTVLVKKLSDDEGGSDLNQARFWCIKNSEKLTSS